MKAAKAKEAASLPRRPEPAKGVLPPDLEQGVAPQEAERTALLQASSFAVLEACLETADRLTREGETLVMQSNDGSQVGRGGCFQEQKRLDLGQVETQIQYNEALIDERDQGIAEISQQIGEVNEIFQASASVVLVPLRGVRSLLSRTMWQKAVNV